MKLLLSLLLLFTFSSNPLFAQHYSCISPEYKTWFNNSKGYLKGMRIDSVQVAGGQKIYYPFRTARVRAENGSHADTLGGSWLGKTIVENVDGSGTFMLNKWGDTIFIKNNAALNESWVLYHDTSTVFISATVVSIDTMTMANIFDSVKMIRLNVMDGNTELVGDSLNNLELIISKEHGFFQAVELYLLPFQQPGDSVYDSHIDMYLQEYLRVMNWEFKREYLTFRRVAYEYPNQKEIFDYQLGDVFIRRSYTDFWDWNVYKDDRDSVLSRTATSNGFLISMERTFYRRFADGTTNNGTEYLTVACVDFLLADTLKMPEEWHTIRYSYFISGDSSFCYTSDKYMWFDHFLNEDGSIYQFEQSRNSLRYKGGMGITNQGSESIGGESRYDIVMRGARKNGQLCNGENLTVSTGTDLTNNQIIKIYPNPADDYIHINFEEDAPNQVSLTDITGRNIAVEVSEGKTKIGFSVSHIPSGIYLLHLRFGSKNVVRKIVLHHQQN